MTNAERLRALAHENMRKPTLTGMVEALLKGAEDIEWRERVEGATGDFHAALVLAVDGADDEHVIEHSTVADRMQRILDLHAKVVAALDQARGERDAMAGKVDYGAAARKLRDVLRNAEDFPFDDPLDDDENAWLNQESRAIVDAATKGGK